MANKPNLSVGRGEKQSVSSGGGLTAKGRKKYNRATGSNLKAPHGSVLWQISRTFLLGEEKSYPFLQEAV